MKLAKKILTITALVTMGLSIAFLISAIFGAPVFENSTLLHILLSFALLAVACAFAISSVNLLTKKKLIPIICLSLLGLSTILMLINIWTNFNASEFFNRATITISVATIFFVIIVSMIIKYERRYLAIQIITYILVVIVDILITLIVWGVDIFGITAMTEIFWTLCLVTFAMLCTLSILGRKNVDIKKEKKLTDDKITISKEEYENMKNEIERLKKENEELKRK